jgi:hypothetical protein
MTYDAWRASIPWSTAQIVAALDAESARVPTEFLREKRMAQARRLEQTGRLSTRILNAVLPALITQCVGPDCSRPALYRIGTRGYCRIHKTSPNAALPERAARRERDNTDREHAAREVDRQRRVSDIGWRRPRPRKG